MNASSENALRQGFKYFNRFMLLMWRLGLGRWINAWPDVFGRIMVIAHTGRKSGRRRYTPVNYAPAGEDVYCTAGFGGGSDWYRNMMANPQVEIWLPDGWWQAVAEDASDSSQRLERMREVLIASAFAARIAGLDPKTMSDAELDEKTHEYRLVRINRAAARTGAGGPGDLAWVWPLATFLLLPLALRKRKKG